MGGRFAVKKNSLDRTASRTGRCVLAVTLALSVSPVLPAFASELEVFEVEAETEVGPARVGGALSLISLLK